MHKKIYGWIIIGLLFFVACAQSVPSSNTIVDRYEVIIQQNVELYSIITKEYAVYTTVYVRDKVEREFLTLEYTSIEACVKKDIQKTKDIEFKKALIVKNKIKTSLIEVYNQHE